MKETPQKADLRLLLLQIRDSAQVRREEHASFAAYCGVTPEQVEVLNVFDTPHFGGEVLNGFDCLLVGGASEASVMAPERYPFVESCIRLMKFCMNQDIPVFGSCFGFQLAVLALGGRIVRDESGYEMGTPPIYTSPAAAHDPLFTDVPDGFRAVSVHKERAPELPSSCELLAYTDVCPHAFRVRGKNFWAFQFHPEVDRATLVERLTHYKAHYTDGDDQLQTVLDAIQETPEANRLMRKFVERVLLGKPYAGAESEASA
jgi:GMP synthase (glutamine-hydrolysing)